MTSSLKQVGWYFLYTYWALTLAILQYLHIISFSAMPSVILVTVGIITLCIWKIAVVHIPINLTYVCIQILLHSTPFLLIPLKFTLRDVWINCIIIMVYLLLLYIMKINFISIYSQVAHENGEVTFGEFLKSRKVI
jgi:hypothetical protein